MLMGLAKGGFSGIGILAVPLLALVVSPVQAASITLPILIVQDVVSVWAFRRFCDRRSIALLLPGSVAGIVLGYLLAARVSAEAVELAIGVTSLAFGARQLWIRWRGTVKAHEPSSAAGVAWGAVSGFTSQIAHAGAVPFQIYMLPKRLERDMFIGTAAWYFAIVNWIKVPVYAALGQLTRANMATSLALFPVAIASTLIGVAVVRRVPAEKFYTAVYVALIIVGLRLTWTGAATLS